MIGVFDSGFGGLTILKDIRRLLPEYDYMYLGDNARTPYGTRSFDVVYAYTLEAVSYLFSHGCSLIVLACNTASAKALRTIQQNDLARLVPLFPDGLPQKRVLGIIRPTVEAVGALTRTGHIGVLATQGTVDSLSYPLEIKKINPDIVVSQQACPMWVPLVENAEFDLPGADYFVDKYLRQLLAQDPLIDTVLLGCTHYPLLVNKIRSSLDTLTRDNGQPVSVLTQGDIVARSLKDYLFRHPEIESSCTKGGSCLYLTTESEQKFRCSASVFMDEDIDVHHIDL